MIIDCKELSESFHNEREIREENAIKQQSKIEAIVKTVNDLVNKLNFFFFFYAFFFSGTKHPREDNPNLYYWAEITGLHTQTFNI